METRSRVERFLLEYLDSVGLLMKDEDLALGLLTMFKRDFQAKIT